ncbi:MAG: SprB repeat-containing protein [Bacteroidales bacterium]|nr:SprB repeat-containing protein [Bacteroidales bacterium]MCF8454788.1 SprB repeat-containing protein [Bacteroidales bacterium]
MYKLAFLIFVFLLVSCSKDKNIVEEVPPIPEIEKFQVKCNYIRPTEFGEQNGSVEAIVNGGIKPYSFSWYLITSFNTSFIELSNESTLSNISTGYYKVIISDSLNEIIADSIFVASHDTINTSPYIAAYPNSYWIYSNGDTVFCNMIQKFPYISKTYWVDYSLSLTGIIYPIDSIYLPVLDCRPIINDKYLNYNWAFNHEIVLVSTLIDQIFHNSFDERVDMELIKAIAIDTSIEIGNQLYENVIIMEQGGGATGSSFEDLWRYEKTYYAKNIGLIRKEHRSAEDSIYTNDFDLVDYQINYSN